MREAGIARRAGTTRDEIINSDDVFFCATGITTGLMVEGVERSKHPLQGSDHDGHRRNGRAADHHQLIFRATARARRKP